MTTKSFYFPFLIICSFGFFACNPDCENYARVTAQVTPKIRLPGEQVLVTTSPPDFLMDKELFIEKVVNGELKINDSTKVQSTYMPTARGRVVTLPMDAEGVRNLYIKDNDCGGFIPISTEPINIVDQAYITRNQSLFIAPSPANIIIPTVNIVPPGTLTNRWFSPYTPNYSIWFKPLLQVRKNGTDSCFVEQLTLKAGLNGGRPGDGGTWEVSQCGSGLIHANPISGIMDKKTGFVSITIDRTAKGLGMEHYEGILTTPDALPAKDRIIPASNCDGPIGGTPAEKMLILTSKETGRQLILLRNHADPVVPKGTFCD